MDDSRLLYRAKNEDKWIYGYPVIKDGVLCIFEKDTEEIIPVPEYSLCQKVGEYFENDVFKIRGFHWIIKYEKALNGYNLVREDPKIHFSHYLPLSNIEDGKFLGNTIDTPSLIVEE